MFLCVEVSVLVVFVIVVELMSNNIVCGTVLNRAVFYDYC